MCFLAWHREGLAKAAAYAKVQSNVQKRWQANLRLSTTLAGWRQSAHSSALARWRCRARGLALLRVILGAWQAVIVFEAESAGSRSGSSLRATRTSTPRAVASRQQQHG